MILQVDILTVMGIEQDTKNEQWTEHLIEMTLSIFQSLKELENNKFQRMMYDLILILFDCAQFQTKKSKKSEMLQFNWPLFAVLFLFYELFWLYIYFFSS